jgi:predicted dehydrogenase
MRQLLRNLPPGVKNLVRAAVNKTIGKSPATIPRAACSAEKLPPLRTGIVGLGMMGRNHADVLHLHPFFSLAGIASARPEATKFAEDLGCRSFDSAQQMIASGELDVLVIATPHWQHAELCVAGLQAGLHVVCEKPLSVTPAQADEVLRAAEQSQRLLAVVFQSRFEPACQKTRALLSTGAFGPILRCDIVESFWRSELYYKSSPWRGTWNGEGGGVLVNQAPHILDRYVWYCGLPASVFGYCDTALHQIEVEDSASALFRHADGAHGHVHVSTNECPSTSRMMIACDRGQITIENGSARIARLADSIRMRTGANKTIFGDIECQLSDLAGAPIDYSAPELLNQFYDNLGLAVAGKAKLMVSGREAAQSVELAAAIRLSSANGRVVSLPVNRGEYDTLMAGKVGQAIS